MNIDVAIIGAGPSGVTAAIYLKRAGVDFMLFENQLIGGKVNLTAEIDNYPPFKNIVGYELADKYAEDLKHNEIKVTAEEIIEVSKEDKHFIVKSKKQTYIAKCVLICSGVKNKFLHFENEEKYLYKGISTCAICDGNLFKGQPMAVVGGGNSALEEALYLAKITNKVYLIHRRDEFRGSKQYVDLVKSNPHIEILTPCVINKAEGEEKLQKLLLQNVNDSSLKEIEVAILFEYVGWIANTEFVKINEIKDENGFIVVNNYLETSIPGLFASGDVTNKKLRQIIVASGDGALASQSIINYLQTN